MEKNSIREKSDFGGGNNPKSSIFLIPAYLSWLLLAVNNLASLKWLYEKAQIWCVQTIQNIQIPSSIGIDSIPNIERRLQDNLDDIEICPSYIPIQMDYIIIYIVFNIEIVISFIGCAVFLVKTLIKKEQSVIEGMMGKISQFHFFPLLCAFILSLLPEITKEAEEGKKDNSKEIAYTGLAFSLIGFVSMLFIYINTEFKSQDWWAEYTLKKGTFSCLLILFWYNFWYDIYPVGLFDKKSHNKEVPKGFARNCGISFSIIVGIGSLAFSFIFKDIVVCFMNILIYYGMAKFYFDSVSPICGTTKACNKNGDGAIDMIILIISIILFVYQIIGLIIEYVTYFINIENIKLKNLIVTISRAQNQTIVKVNANSEQINMLSSNINLTSKA